MIEMQAGFEPFHMLVPFVHVQKRTGRLQNCAFPREPVSVHNRMIR